MPKNVHVTRIYAINVHLRICTHGPPVYLCKWSMCANPHIVVVYKCTLTTLFVQVVAVCKCPTKSNYLIHRGVSVCAFCGNGRCAHLRTPTIPDSAEVDSNSVEISPFLVYYMKKITPAFLSSAGQGWRKAYKWEQCVMCAEGCFVNMRQIHVLVCQKERVGEKIMQICTRSGD